MAATSAPEGSASVDRKSTRLNSSHTVISYAVFCLKKKKSHERDRKHGERMTNDDRVFGLPLHRVYDDVVIRIECRRFFVVMIRRPPRSTLFPTRRSSD